jgi:hypothetical protein
MWTFGGTKVIVQTFDTSQINTIVRLQPIVGGTILQHFGYESPIVKITGIVVGDVDRDALEVMSKTSDSPQDLYFSTTLVDSYYLHGFTSSRQQEIYQTMRPDLDCTAPVYKVEMELYPTDE